MNRFFINGTDLITKFHMQPIMISFLMTLSDLPKSNISTFSRKHQIRKMSIFVSALGDEMGPDCDIDFLVEFEEGHVPNSFELFEMEDEPSSLIGGTKANIRTLEDLSIHFRNDVKNRMLVQFES